MTVANQTPLPRLNDPQSVLPWADRLVTELWRRLFDIAEGANDASATGEVNTGANVGTDGVGVFDGKSGVQLQFRHIAPGSTRVTATLNGNDIDLDVVINDAGSSNGDLWSAAKIASEIAAGTGHSHTNNEDLSGAGPYVLAATPVTGSERVYVNGVLQKNVASPGLGEYSISGDTITFGWDVSAEAVWADYEVGTSATHAHTHHEELTGSGVGPYTLAATPLSSSEKLYVNGFRQRRVASSPALGEYYMSAANQVTLGWSKAAGDYMEVDYLT